MATRIGDRIPNFSLPDQNHQITNISNYIGKRNLVIFFYPKDNSSACTVEACTFRNTFEEFEGLDADIFGISSDSPESHKDFAEKFHLQFKLLADEDKQVRKLFGVPSNFFRLIPGRVTYIVDKHGVVREIFNSLTDPAGHVEQALTKLQELSEERAD